MYKIFKPATETEQLHKVSIQKTYVEVYIDHTKKIELACLPRIYGFTGNGFTGVSITQRTGKHQCFKENVQFCAIDRPRRVNGRRIHSKLVTWVKKLRRCLHKVMHLQSWVMQVIQSKKMLYFSCLWGGQILLQHVVLPQTVPTNLEGHTCLD